MNKYLNNFKMNVSEIISDKYNFHVVFTALILAIDTVTMVSRSNVVALATYSMAVTYLLYLLCSPSKYDRKKTLKYAIVSLMLVSILYNAVLFSLAAILINLLVAAFLLLVYSLEFGKFNFSNNR